MKYLITRNVTASLSDSGEEGFLRGFLEQEPDLFKFKNGFLFETYYGDVRYIPWEYLQLNLENLNLLINDLYSQHYNQKDNLLKSQIYSIIQKLYNQCIVRAVGLEGFNKNQAQIIVSKAYEDGHSSGYTNVICHCWDLISFIESFRNKS